jgi:hypothetical protein
MPATILTSEDLIEFKMELIEDIKTVFQEHSGTKLKKWLKTNEVKDLLGVSNGTLQNLRINGTLSYTKIGGILYYDYEEIHKTLEQNRISNKY